ncbi:IclR family transcriptional regulator [Ramlibacter aurantiacus]|uniref:IclR family transcriptional regulator n=1 Tax=Ramlibacter aurantiacus TaxID=2801330 RepID=UPI001F26D06C|nr:IclR family transcriptional regulator [Ramlibacter aurantiacus]
MQVTINDPNLVPALDRGLRLLKLFGPDRPALSFTQVCELMGLPRSTCFRLLHTLTLHGFLSFAADTKLYRPGPGLLSLGFAFISSVDLVDIATPKLRRLCDRLRANTHLGILEGSEVVYIARARADAELVSNIAIGSRLPAHASPMGQVLLSGLDDDELKSTYAGLKLEKFGPTTPSSLTALRRILQTIRQDGCAIARSSMHPGVASVAAPIFDSRKKRIIAAINAVGPEASLEKLGLENVVAPEVRKVAEEISAELHH